MKKLTVLVAAGDRDQALMQLRDLGNVHIEVGEVRSGADIQTLEGQLEQVDRALEIVAAIDTGPTANESGGTETVTADHILELEQQRQALRERLEELHRQVQWYVEWGAVSPAVLSRVQKAGLAVRFYRVEKKELGRLSAEDIFYVLGGDGNQLRIVHVAAVDQAPPAWDSEPMPGLDRTAVEAEIGQVEEALHQVEYRLQTFSNAAESLRAQRRDLQQQVQFQRVKASMGRAGAIAYLQGFSPIESSGLVEEAAREYGWACLIEEPGEGDEVPVLIKRARWAQMVEPVFAFMGTVPGYREYDISIWFLLFFSLFFALLIGDAGYGTIFLLVSLLCARKFSAAPRTPFILMYVLSAATIVWGALSGTWFGYDQVARIPGLNGLVLERLDSFVSANQSFMMLFSFVIGVVHLTIARLIVFRRYFKSLKGLAELGWIAIIWALFFVAGNLVLRRPLPEIALPALGVGILLVLLFANPRKQVWKGVLQTLSDLPLAVISTFADIVSYLRLFAVGYASVIVASSFNEMAMGIGFGSVLSGGVAAVVLFLGHGINIILGLMAVVVHGMRLNMLEFSGHLNMQWSGKAYKPFRS
ncbi:MAG: hypothetical protein GKR89_10805 [Candidatus Latescibacteria bacterium]|nr:hypothetical protein [Candidatus Latescibacterota bacterium]